MKDKKDQKWAWFILLVILITGTFLLVITPMGANYDEETHVARIWEMSRGHVLPNSLFHKLDSFPVVIYDTSFRRYSNLPTFTFSEWKDQIKIPFDLHQNMKYTTRAVYFPSIYALQAVLIGITGRLFDFPIYFIYYVLRFSYLLIYCLFVYLTLRVLPTGRRLFGVIAVAPAAIIQSAAISADAFVFGISFLFTGWILHLLAEPSKKLSQKQLLITLVLILAVGTLKPNCVFLLLLLFMLPRSLRLTKGQKWALVITVLLSIAISAGWNVVASQYFLARDETGKNPVAQLLSIFKDPLGFFGTFFASVKSGGLSLMMQSIGVSGYGYYNLPKFIYLMYPALLLLAILAEDSQFRLSLRQNLYLAAAGLFNVLTIFVIFFIVETQVGAETISGLQGRYFTPLFLFVFSCLLFLPRLKTRLVQYTVYVGILLISTVTAISIYADYHIPCGYTWFSGKECVMPKYKNWDASSFVSYSPSNTERLEEVIAVKCKEMNAIRLWVNNNPGDKNYIYTLSLVNSHGKLIYANDFTGFETASYGWMTYAFTPLKDVYGEQYFVNLTSDAPAGSQGIQFGAFKTNEVIDGYFQVNGNSGGYAPDLVIQYGCGK